MVKMSKGCGGSDNPDITTEDESRRLFRIVGANRKDIFYDLGCGYGNPCIVAARDFKIRKVVGIEYCRDNYLEAFHRIMEKRLTDKIWLWHGSVQKSDFSDGTLVYCTLEPNLEIIKHIEKQLKRNCRLITPTTPLPSIKSVKEFELDGDKFYLMKAPLRNYKAKNPDDWAQSFGYSDFKEFTKDDNIDEEIRRNVRKVMRQIYAKKV